MERSASHSHTVTQSWPYFFVVLWWLCFLYFPSISVRVEKEDLCWWSNETAILQEPWATCAHTAREWVMKWQHSNADLAGSDKYNLKDSSVYSEDQLQPRNKDTIILARCDSCCIDLLFLSGRHIHIHTKGGPAAEGSRLPEFILPRVRWGKVWVFKT